MGFTWASQVVLVVKNPPADAGDIRDQGSIPGLGRILGGGHANPLQYSCLENPMDKGAWRAIVHGVAKSQTRIKLLSMHTWGFLKSFSLDGKSVNQAESAHTCVWRIDTEV